MKLADAGTLLRIWAENVELTARDIREVFGCSLAQASKLKSKVVAEQLKREIPFISPHSCNTEVAYEVWGISIDSLKKRATTLKKIGA